VAAVDAKDAWDFPWTPAETDGSRPRADYDELGHTVVRPRNAGGSFQASDMALVEDTPGSTAGVKTTSGRKGYNPYESGQVAERGGPKKRTDLRRLSSWILTKRNLPDDRE
jgi:hypothetical protein